MTEAQTPAPNSVDAVIAAAKAAAAAKKQTAGTEVATTATSAGGAVSTNVAPRTMTLDDLSGSSMNVDSFLKVNEHGLEIKAKDKPVSGLIESVLVSIDIAKDVQVFEGIKYGNPAVYAKTYDGARAVNGGTWSDAVKKAQMADPGASTYTGADITMKLVDDAKDLKGVVAASKGTVLGHSTSTTNKVNFKKFIDEVTAGNLRDSIVLARVTNEKRSNKSGNVWGVLAFELIGEYNA